MRRKRKSPGEMHRDSVERESAILCRARTLMDEAPELPWRTAEKIATRQVDRERWEKANPELVGKNLIVVRKGKPVPLDTMDAESSDIVRVTPSVNRYIDSFAKEKGISKTTAVAEIICLYERSKK